MDKVIHEYECPYGEGPYGTWGMECCCSSIRAAIKRANEQAAQRVLEADYSSLKLTEREMGLFVAAMKIAVAAARGEHYE